MVSGFLWSSFSSCIGSQVHPSAGWLRRPGTAHVSLHLVEIGLLQCRPCRPSGFNVGAVPESAACCGSFGQNLRPRDHVSAALGELHWLQVAQRIDYKLCLLVHNVMLVLHWFWCYYSQCLWCGQGNMLLKFTSHYWTVEFVRPSTFYPLPGGGLRLLVVIF